MAIPLDFDLEHQKLKENLKLFEDTAESKQQLALLQEEVKSHETQRSELSQQIRDLQWILQSIEKNIGIQEAEYERDALAYSKVSLGEEGDVDEPQLSSIEKLRRLKKAKERALRKVALIDQQIELERARIYYQKTIEQKTQWEGLILGLDEKVQQLRPELDAKMNTYRELELLWNEKWSAIVSSVVAGVTHDSSQEATDEVKKAVDEAVEKATEDEHNKLMPFITTACDIRGRKLEWTKPDHNKQDKEIMSQGNRASHYGAALTDALMFTDACPAEYRRTDIQTYKDLYQFDPAVVIDLRACTELIQILDWYAGVKNFHQLYQPNKQFKLYFEKCITFHSTTPQTADSWKIHLNEKYAHDIYEGKSLYQFFENMYEKGLELHEATLKKPKTKN